MSKRFVAIGAWAFVLLASVAFAADQKSDAGPQPSIEIPRMTQDFGNVFERPTYEYAFAVKNRGDAALVIESVKPGCGCTVAKFDSIIAPGSEGQIKLVLDGGRVHGKFQKTATVKCNDPEHPVLTLTIAGNEVPYVNVEPQGTIYLHGRYDEDVVKSVVLSSNEKDVTLKIKGVSSNIDDKIDYSYKPGPGKGETTLTISKKKNLPTSSAYGAITVKTNSTKAPDTILQVHVMTKGSISVTPSTLNYGVVKFGNKTPGDPVTKSVMVLSTEGSFQIKNVDVSNKNFTAKVSSIREGKQYKIEVTFKPPVQKDAQQREIGEMVVNTTDPHEPAITVHLVARAM